MILNFFPPEESMRTKWGCWDGEVEVLSRLMFADCVEIAGEWGSLIQLHQSGFHFYLNCCFRAEIFWQGYNVFLQRRNKETWDYDPPRDLCLHHSSTQLKGWKSVKMFSCRFIHNSQTLCQEAYFPQFNHFLIFYQSMSPFTTSIYVWWSSIIWGAARCSRWRGGWEWGGAAPAESAPGSRTPGATVASSISSVDNI